MGLDMYLVAQGYLSQYEPRSREVSEAVAACYSDLPEGVRVRGVEFEVGYWRKANAIHRWFVENVQDNEDDCGTYDVPREKLVKLKETCQQVIDDPSKAFELLPPSSGFFFGSTAVDEWYLDSLRSTIEICETAVAMRDRGFFIQYHSSW